MSRTLAYLNFFGVVALTALCALQWSTNRALNLDVNQLEKSSQTQAAQLDEQAAHLRGLTTDLDRFRTQLSTTTLDLQGAHTQLRASEQLAAELARERDQLRDNLTHWRAAVALRDESLQQANERIRELGERLNTRIGTFNELVAKYNEVVRQLNEARAPQPATP
jgi:chromosome segregation ATPase